VVVAASALALKLGDEPDTAVILEITQAIMLLFVVFPLQPTPMSNQSSKAAGFEFFGGLGARFPNFLLAARAACVAASAAASAADAAANAAAAAAATPPPLRMPSSKGTKADFRGKRLEGPCKPIDPGIEAASPILNPTGCR
jgi:hypothetical protein